MINNYRQYIEYIFPYVKESKGGWNREYYKNYMLDEIINDNYHNIIDCFDELYNSFVINQDKNKDKDILTYKQFTYIKRKKIIREILDE